MSPMMIFGIAAGGAILLFLVLIICIRVSNTNRFNKKFKKNFDKISKDNANDTVDLSFDKPVKPSVKTGAPVIEDYVDEDDKEKQDAEKEEKKDKSDNAKALDERFEKAMKRFEEISRRNRERQEAKAEEEEETEKENSDDFEEFMNEHSYGRMFADKNLFEQIQDLSPELKAILFSGIFRPYDDGKKD